MELGCQAISKDINTLLESKQTLRFHSIFDKGLNLIVDETLVFISEAHVPFGITLHPHMFQYFKFVNEHTRIVHYHQQIHFDDLILDYGMAQVLDYTLNTVSDIRYASVLYNFLINKENETGLGMPLNKVKDIQKIQGFYTRDYHHGVHYLCGRGKGLTPSGDDILLGVLACMQLFDRVDPKYVAALNTLNPDQTTAISNTYLYYAKRKQYAHVLREFLRSIEFGSLDTQMQCVLQYGHTSGIDTMAGILLGITLILGEKL